MPQSQYPIPPSDADEFNRLALQDKLLNEHLSLFFSGITCPNRVLDIACGTGGWLREVKRACPNSECVGLDKSALLLGHAQNLAMSEHVNVTYKQGDMFDIAKASKYKPFDYIQMRCATWFLGRRMAEIFTYCHQMLVPDGVFCVIDFEQPFYSNSVAMKKYNAAFLAALNKRGTVYAGVDEFSVLLRSVGFVDIQEESFDLNLSAGVEGREGFIADMRNVFAIFRSMILSTGVFAEEEYEEIKQQCISDLDSPGFEMIWRTLSVSGRKA